MRALTIGWKTSTLSPEIASLRYRALFPLLALENLGFKNKICIRVNRSFLSELDALVIVKSFTWDDYWLTLEATKLNIPVIYDLCDNIFINQYGNKNKKTPSDVFLLIVSNVDAITVTTEPLARIVREQIGTGIPIYVVPDGIESKILLAKIKRRLLLPRIFNYANKLMTTPFKFLIRSYRRFGSILKTGAPLGIIKNIYKCRIGFPYRCLKLLYRIYDKGRSRLTRTSPKLVSRSNTKIKVRLAPSKIVNITAAHNAKKILWFGNHGAEHAKFGMLDLLLIREILEKLASEFPLELIVVSNNFEKYKKHIRSMAIPSCYFEWSAESMTKHFHDADVVVIPNSLDKFSICKSANRTVLALLNGVPVVATSTPALEALNESIVLDDFESGIRRYLTDASFSENQVKKGQEKIERLYSQQTIGLIWKEVIDNAVHQYDPHTKLANLSPELIVAIHLCQDVALAFPVLEEAYNQGIKCAIWTSIVAIKRWPSLLNTIRSSGFSWQILPDDPNEARVNLFPSTSCALLSVTESNLNPHRFTRQLTELANEAGLYTATMQHGYENIGLSYSDDIHNIRRINFAASHIFTWGNNETLHSSIPTITLNKCIPVGCPKPAKVDPKPLPSEIKAGATIIGIFENLHWHRYSDDYRASFLEGVSHLASLYPDVVFIVKPHNAGMWLTDRCKEGKPRQSNVFIVDPLSPDWVDIMAPQLLSHLKAVITTPSTVALDAARVGIPTAIVAQGLNLKNYSPLPLINAKEDWSDFIRQVLNSQEQVLLQKMAYQFVDRVLLPSDNSARRIVEEIKTHKINHNQVEKNAA